MAYFLIKFMHRNTVSLDTDNVLELITTADVHALTSLPQVFHVFSGRLKMSRMVYAGF